MTVLIDSVMYIRNVNSPDSKPAGTRPHQLCAGRIENSDDNTEIIVTAVTETKMSRAGRFDLMI